jgi:hypothetical protein
MAINPLSEKELLAAIKGSGGIISNISKRLKVDWHTANNLIKKNPNCLLALEDEKEKILDLAETKIIEAMMSGDTSTSKWVLATQGRKRGWSENIKIDHSGEVGITINIVDDDTATD